MKLNSKLVNIFLLLTNYLSVSTGVVSQTELWVQRGNDIYGRQGGASGWSVGLNAVGNVVAIGEPYDDNGYGRNAGRVRVYDWNTTTGWNKRGQDIYGDAENDYAGWFVCLNADGNVVAFGAFGNDAGGTDAGRVQVYEWNTTAWNQRGANFNGEAANDSVGRSVSLNADGNVVALGAVYNDGAGTNVGRVRIYEWNTTAWNPRGSYIDGEAIGDFSGYSVSLNTVGDVVAIGAIRNDGAGADAGHVRVYKWDATSWNQLGDDIDGESAGDNSGYSVSLNAVGDVVAIGAIRNDGAGTDTGHARIYQWNATAWNQLGDDIDGELEGDNSGYSVSLNAVGDVVAVGARFNDKNGNSNTGHARIHHWNSTAWNQLGYDIDGGFANDWLGQSVSLNNDGDVIAVGVPGYDGPSSNSGAVRVYVLAADELVSK